ncbi:SET domain-containing protein [Poronia punctata]|nr:SET domain-containing protein [Poronia punctata]
MSETDASGYTDLSTTVNHQEPWELKPAGENKGLGLFATRDVKAGEVVLSDWTPILINNRTLTTEINDIIRRYRNMQEDIQKSWRELSLYEHPGRVAKIVKRLRRWQGPDGSKLDEEELDLVLRLVLIYYSNGFEAKPNVSGVFLDASRFNHSCDPNVWYETNTRYGRWIGRASRNIKKGEEFTVVYLPCHASREEKQAETRETWGFDCDCPKCTGGLDEYTASLEEACAIENFVETGRGKKPTVYSDDVDDIERQLSRRVELLREIVKKLDNSDKEKARHKELVYALWDNAFFYYHLYVTKGREGEQVRSDLEAYVATLREALDVARTVWAEGHEMVKACKIEARVARTTLKRVLSEKSKVVRQERAASDETEASEAE